MLIALTRHGNFIFPVDHRFALGSSMQPRAPDENLSPSTTGQSSHEDPLRSALLAVFPFD